MIQGMSGIMDLTGEPDGAPQKIGVAFADIFAGTYGAIAVLAALAQRERTGIGQHIDMALLDSMVGGACKPRYELSTEIICGAWAQLKSLRSSIFSKTSKTNWSGKALVCCGTSEDGCREPPGATHFRISKRIGNEGADGSYIVSLRDIGVAPADIPARERRTSMHSQPHARQHDICSHLAATYLAGARRCPLLRPRSQ